MGIQSLALCLFSFNQFEPVWKGEKPNRTEINRFEPVFSSVRFGSKTKKNKIGLIAYFDLKPDQTEKIRP